MGRNESNMNLIQLSRGAATLAKWWLEGEPPVSLDEANRRADVCRMCPKNEPADGWWDGGLAARAALALKRKMKLKLEDEQELGVCNACGCILKLKVWVPMEVAARMPAEEKKRLWFRCWIK